MNKKNCNLFEGFLRKAYEGRIQLLANSRIWCLKNIHHFKPHFQRWCLAKNRNTKPSRCMKESPSVFEFPVSIFWWSKMDAMWGATWWVTFYLKTQPQAFIQKIPVGLVSWFGSSENLCPSFCPWVRVSRFFFRLNIKGVIQWLICLDWWVLMGFLLRRNEFHLTLWDFHGSFQEISDIMIFIWWSGS